MTGITYQGTKYAYYSEFGAGVAANLTDYIGQTVDVTFAAVPNSDPNGLCYIAHVLNVKVVAPGTLDEDVANDPYNDISSGYVKSQVAHATCLDSINGLSLAGKGLGGNSLKGPEVYALNSTTLANNRLAIAGWTVVEGGFEKIVWSADGGKTWHEVALRGKDSFISGDGSHITAAETRLNNTYTFVDKNASVAGCRYQGNRANTFTEDTQGIEADLSAYAGQTVNVTFAAVPKGQPNSLCYIAHITGVQVPDAN